MGDIAAILVTLGPKLAQHVLLAASALALGIIIALPLAAWASRSASVARVAFTFASLVQTIPALALLALFFPLLLSLRAIFGEGLPTLGFLPALLALALYALLPILRNAVTAREHMAADDLLRVLRPLLGQIDVAAMRRANHAVDRAENKRSPAEAGRMLARDITR